jgi:lysozyme family protein
MSKLTTFKEIMDVIIENEGGYVNDPDDRGRETKYGISKRSHPEVDIKNLTIDGALDIYNRLYWVPSKAERLMPELRYQYFDFVVNAGQGNAVKVLQRACNHKNGKGNWIQVDGKIGRMTIKASENLENSRLKAFKCLYYANIVIKNSIQEKYYYGWYNRIHKH